MMLLNSRMFLIDLNTFMTSLADLLFHLTLLLNRCRVVLVFVFFFSLPGASVSSFFSVCG